MRSGSASSADGELIAREAVQAEEREREGGGEGREARDWMYTQEGQNDHRTQQNKNDHRRDETRERKGYTAAAADDKRNE